MTDLWSKMIGATPADDSFNDASIEAEFKPTPDTQPTSETPSMGNGGGELWCDAGGHYFTHSGRGRKPKNCPEHRPVASSTSRGTSAKSSKALRELEEDLASTLSKTGIGFATAGLHVTGLIMTDRSARTAAAMVTLAKDHPKALKALSTASKAAPAFELGETVGMLAIGVQLDKHVVEPDSMLPTLTGVVKYWEMVNGPLANYQYQRQQQQYMQAQSETEESRFVPV